MNYFVVGIVVYKTLLIFTEMKMHLLGIKRRVEIILHTSDNIYSANFHDNRSTNNQTPFRIYNISISINHLYF